MESEILLIVAKYSIPLILGYLLKATMNTFKKNKQQTEALKMLLQGNLTALYYKYLPTKEIPEYVYKNWINEFQIYEKLGGDDYIHDLYNKIKDFNIVKVY